MLIMEWWNKMDEYTTKCFTKNCEKFKEETTANMPLNEMTKKMAEIAKQSIKEAEEQLARVYPNLWSAWLEKKDYRIMDSLTCKILGKIGINMKKKARQANIKNIITAAEEDILSAKYPTLLAVNKNDRVDKFTLQEMMLYRQCFILNELGIDYKMVLQ